MPCTTILVGKKASYDGSTIIARDDDGGGDIKKLIVIENQKKEYKSVISHLKIELPDNPLSYTCVPNVNKEHGMWPSAGINSANVAMTATETISSNALVLGADPYVRYKKKSRTEKEQIGGIGEEDLVAIVLPYIKSAREGVLRMAKLLKEYGTYEPNGMAFADEKEIWWLESIGGHHWIAARVKDDEYVVMPNQFGLDHFNLEDALGKKKNYMCSEDLKDFIEDNHLDLNIDGKFNPRLIFGSHSDQDHIYNTARAWYMCRYFNPRTYKWDGENADFTPISDDIPWSMKPERKISIEEVKYILSSHYQGTPYDPYNKGNDPRKKMYRVIGTSGTDDLAILQIRGYMPEKLKALEWICFSSNLFNAPIPVYTSVSRLPAYLSNVSEDISTDNFYWNSVLINALAEAHYDENIQLVERYQNIMACNGHRLINEYDQKMLIDIICQIDPNAFINVMPSQKVIGNFHERQYW